MMTSNDLPLNDLELLARHEEKIGELYDIYADLFQEHKAFWSALARDERSHAGSVRSLSSKVLNGSLDLGERRFTSKALESSLEYIRTWIDEASRGAVSLLKALAVANDIETALIEKDFYKVFDTDNEELKDVFSMLVKASVEHRNKVKNLLTEVRQKGDSAPTALG